MVWHEIVFSIFVGCFIAGILLVSILLFLSASSLSNASQVGSADDADFDTDTDIDTDVDVDAEVDIDVDVDVDTDFDIDTDVDVDLDIDVDTEIDFDADVDAEIDLDSDFDIDSDVDTDFDVDVDVSGSTFTSDLIESKGKTPLALSFSLFLMWSGASGISTYDLIGLKVLWVIIAIGLSVLITIGISKLWQKVAKNSAYRVRLGNELLGRKATVKIPVSIDGGVISVNSFDNAQTIAARSLYPLAYFYPGDQVYIVRVKDKRYFVDSDPDKVEFPKIRSTRKRI